MPFVSFIPIREVQRVACFGFQLLARRELNMFV